MKNDSHLIRGRRVSKAPDCLTKSKCCVAMLQTSIRSEVLDGRKANASTTSMTVFAIFKVVPYAVSNLREKDVSCVERTERVHGIWSTPDRNAISTLHEWCEIIGRDHVVLAVHNVGNSWQTMVQIPERECKSSICAAGCGDGLNFRLECRQVSHSRRD